MRNLSKWLLAALVVVTLSGAAMVLNLGSSPTTAAEPPHATGDHWRNFDGHWSYWHEGDKRWYYTDGVHWYYHDGAGWALYHFDKLFGLVDFHHGDYKPPVDHAHLEMPKHEVFGHR